MGLISAIGDLASTGINSNSGRMSKRKKKFKTKQGEVQGPVKHLPTDLDAVEDQMMSENPTPEGRAINKKVGEGRAQRNRNLEDKKRG